MNSLSSTSVAQILQPHLTKSGPLKLHMLSVMVNVQASLWSLSPNDHCQWLVAKEEWVETLPQTA